MNNQNIKNSNNSNNTKNVEDHQAQKNEIKARNITKRTREMTPSLPVTGNSSYNKKKSKYNVLKLFENMSLANGKFEAENEENVFKTRRYSLKKQFLAKNNEDNLDHNHVKLKNALDGSAVRISLLRKKHFENGNIELIKKENDFLCVFDRIHDRLAKKFDEIRKLNKKLDISEGLDKFYAIFKIKKRLTLCELLKKASKNTSSNKEQITKMESPEDPDSILGLSEEQCLYYGEYDDFNENTYYNEEYYDEEEYYAENDSNQYEEEDVFYGQCFNVPFHEEKSLAIDLKDSDYPN